MSSTVFRLLGPVRVLRGDAEVAIGRGSPTAILTILLLSANRHVSAQSIASRAWGDSAPEDPRATVYSGVSRLRKILGPELISTREGGYLLNASTEQLDLLQFNRHVAQARSAEDAGRGDEVVAALDQALALWSEPVLGGVEAPFAAQAAASLTERYLIACEQRAGWCLRLGRHAEVVRELAPLARAHPARAALAEPLMLALYRSGRRVDALAVFDALRGAGGQTAEGPAWHRANELHVRILRDDPALALPKPATATALAPAPAPEAGSPAPQRSVPRQLPGAGDRFTGRDDELATLDRLLARHPPDEVRNLIVAVDGTAGVGKTTLAVHWAHTVSAHFDGGQLYANLHGYDPDAPADTASVLASFLVALGHKAGQIPDELGARAALFRAATAGRRILILADNARNSQHVRPLLPGPGCLLITTSRDQVRGLAAVNGAHRLTLRTFGEPEALTLLGRIAGADRARQEHEAAVMLVNLCARLPLAVAIAAEYAQRQPDTPIADLAEGLRSEYSLLEAPGAGESPGADLRAVFTWSYRRLSAPAARVFRLLSLHPPSTGIHARAVAALVDVPVVTVLPWLDELVAAHMVESPAPDHHAMHDLLRAYALDQVRREETDEQRASAVDRLSGWYRRTAARAQQRLRPTAEPVPAAPRGSVAPLEFDDYEQALAWFDAEHGNLVALIREMLGTGTPVAAIAAVDLLWQMRGFYTNRPYWDEWAELGRLARGSGDTIAEVRSLSCIGTADLFRRRYASALAAYSEARGLIPDDYMGIERASVLSQTGLAHLMTDDAEQAAAVLREALASPYADDLPIRSNLAGALGALGAFDDALEYGYQALDQHTRRGERDAAGRALCNIAEAHLCLKDHDRAIETARQAVQTFRGIGNVDGEVCALMLLGRILTDHGDRGAARETLTRALTLLTSVGAAESETAQAVRAGLDALKEDCVL